MSDLDKEFINFQTKKSVHINLTRGTHSEFRSELFKRHLSMQEVFEHLACQFAEGHPSLVKLIDEYCEMKKADVIRGLEEKYTENLYEAIGDDNLFGD